MSIQQVDYIPCTRCYRTLIGETEKYLCVWTSESVSVFEVTINWICLGCGYNLEERVEIWEVRHT